MDQELRHLCRCLRQAASGPLGRPAAARRKADGSLVTGADLEVQARLARRLPADWPGTRVLGEEDAPAAQAGLLAAHGEGGLWVLDPLDGTTNFAWGLPWYSVSCALLDEGGTVLAAVWDPHRDECFAARRGGGAWLDGVPLAAPPPPAELADCIALVDFKRLPPDLAVRLARRPPWRSQRNFGSVALEWCWLAAGRGHLYLHGGQHLWDCAAGSLVLAEAGGRAATLDGGPVMDARLGKRSVVAALDEALFERWRAWLAG